MSDKYGVVNIHGKQYKTVILRVNEFSENCSSTDGWGIVTELLYHDKDRAVVGAKIIDPSGRVVGSGLAEEWRNAIPSTRHLLWRWLKRQLLAVRLLVLALVARSTRTS